MAATPFLVASHLVNLAVTVQDGAVTHIRLHGRATRPPETPLENQVARELEEYFAGTRSRCAVRRRARPSSAAAGTHCWRFPTERRAPTARSPAAWGIRRARGRWDRPTTRTPLRSSSPATGW